MPNFTQADKVPSTMLSTGLQIPYDAHYLLRLRNARNLSRVLSKDLNSPRQIVGIVTAVQPLPRREQSEFTLSGKFLATA